MKSERGPPKGPSGLTRRWVLGGIAGGSVIAVGAGYAFSGVTLERSAPLQLDGDRITVENLRIIGVPGRPALAAAGCQGLRIRNCRIEHPVGCPGIALVECPGAVVENCDFVVSDAPLAGALAVETNGLTIMASPDVAVRRVRMRDSSAGIYVVESARVRLHEIEGYDQRGPHPRGNLVQFDKCEDGVLEGFSTRNAIDVAATGDNVSVFGSRRCVIRRGLVDGNNDPSGAGVIFERSEDGICEDVDVLHFSNCAFAAYPSKRVVFRRCGARDSYRPTPYGEPLSRSIVFAVSPDSEDIRAVETVYFAHVNPANVVWDRSRFTEYDVREEDFRPRRPVRLRGLPG